MKRILKNMNYFLIMFVLLFCLYSCDRGKNITINHYQLISMLRTCIASNADVSRKKALINELEGYVVTTKSLYAHFVIAECSKSIGNYEVAIKHLSYLVKNEYEEISIVYELRADCFVKLKQFRNALNDYTSSIQHGAMRFGVFGKRGDLYVRLRKYLLAINDYQEALNILKARRDCGNKCDGYSYNEVKFYNKILFLYKKLNLLSEYRSIAREASARNPGAKNILLIDDKLL